MKLSTFILALCLLMFIFGDNVDGSSIWDDARAVGLDLGSSLTIELPLGE